jgi:hypothetical protein
MSQSDLRARVSKDGAATARGRIFETHRQRGRVCGNEVLASRCDAPQHEGGD